MLFTVLTAAYVALFAYYVYATTIVQPFWDMYSHVLRYLRFREDGAWWTYLWDPHVQHHQVWMRLLTAFDVESFSGVAYPFVVTSTACMVAAAWLLRREVHIIGPASLRVAIGSLVVMLVLTSVAAVDCAIPINGVYPQTLLFTVLALVLFDERGSETEHARRTQWRRLAAVLAAVAAAFANAVALVLWPILIWTAWRVGAGRRWIVGLIVCGSAFAVVYTNGVPLTAQGSAGPDDGAAWYAADHLLKTGDYLVAFLGLPWTRAEALSWPGRAVGAVLLVVGVWTVIRYGFVHPAGVRLERVATGLIMFSLAAAVLATVGRVDVDPGVRVPVRYSVLVAPLHVGLLWLATPWLSRAWTVPARRRMIQRSMVGAAVALLVQQVAVGQAAVATTDAMRSTIQRFIAGETDPAMARVVFDDLEEARQSWETIRKAGIYVER